MDMETLLKKSDHKMCAVKAEVPLKEVITLLFEEDVKAVVVIDAQNNLCGLLSEHDVVSAVNKHGDEVMSLQAKDVMSVDLTVCTPESSLREALSYMEENNVRHLPIVTKGGHLFGLVGVLDVVREFLLSIDAISHKK